MNQKVHNQIVSFIWGIADDVLRDVFVRGKYRDIILPFTVLRRLDVLLVPTKNKVLEANDFLIKEKIDNKSALQIVQVILFGTFQNSLLKLCLMMLTIVIATSKLILMATARMFRKLLVSSNCAINWRQ